MPDLSDSDKEFEAEMDLNTMKRAEEIKADPARKKAAEEKAAKEINALKKIKGKSLINSSNKSLVTK
jgi:hypothetical protein